MNRPFKPLKNKEMKFDTLIIGGGLAGLLCGVRLQEAGQKCAILSSGQNAMHFFSGGFGLLSRLADGSAVEEPLKAIPSLESSHPYSKIGADKVAEYTQETVEFFKSHGIQVEGNAEKNSYLITGSGALKPTWLAAEEIAHVKDKSESIGDKVLIVNIEGFMDFNTSFIAGALEKRGAKCRIVAVTTDELCKLRTNPTEMRSSNIAKIMESPVSLNRFATEVKAQIKDEDTVILPDVFGIKSHDTIASLRKQLGIKTLFIGTLPPSVAGIRIQMQLKEAFIAAGGTFLKGDEAKQAEFEGNKVISIKSANLEDVNITADNYVLATGSYFGHGLVSDAESISEPIFGADVIFDGDRNNWFDKNFFRRQDYISFGVDTDSAFLTKRNGDTVKNLYAIGSILGGFNALYEGCGAGVAIMTAFRVSDTILGR